MSKKNKKFKSEYGLAVKIVASICALLMFGTLFLTLLY